MSAPKITLDPCAAMAYVLLSPERAAGHGETRELPDGTLVDTDHLGFISGVELFQPTTTVDIDELLRIGQLYPEDEEALRQLDPIDWAKPGHYDAPRASNAA